MAGHHNQERVTDVSITGWARREAEGVEVAWRFEKEHTTYLTCLCVRDKEEVGRADSCKVTDRHWRDCFKEAFTPERRHGRTDGP